jgi:hypothetical protein
VKSINKPWSPGSLLNQEKCPAANTPLYQQQRTTNCYLHLRYKCIKTEQQPHEQILQCERERPGQYMMDSTGTQVIQETEVHLIGNSLVCPWGSKITWELSRDSSGVLGIVRSF